MNKTVLIVAGGSGTRMNSSVPKQFLQLNSIPVLMHTINKFYAFSPNIAIRLVLPETQFKVWEELCNHHNFKVPYQLYAGGETRFHSVKNGLHQLASNTLVAIHDGVRPLVSTNTIKNCFDAAEEFGAAIPVVPVNESIRRIGATHSEALNRSEYKLVQTPQVFRSDILLEAYKTPYNDIFTDDASVVEHSGLKIQLVEGNAENIKITSPMDLAIAESLLNK